MPDEMTPQDREREHIRSVASLQPAQREARKVIALESIAASLKALDSYLKGFRSRNPDGTLIWTGE